MSKAIRLLVLVSLLLVAVPASQAHAQTPSNCTGGFQASGAIYAICMPPEGVEWNGDLLVYAHGYVAYNVPPGIPQDQLVFDDGTDIPSLITGMGYAFATTSYHENGLAVLSGLEDILDLVNIFKGLGVGDPVHTYLVGPSEGGLITALGIERYPEVFSAGLSLCGPVGDFPQQINYWGDFRVLYDYFFPGVLPGTAMSIPQDVIDQWDTVYKDKVLAKAASNPSKLAQLFKVSKAKYDLSDPSTKLDTVEQVMWYSVFATNDGKEKLGGVPFDNHRKFYYGSSNDILLNYKVKRFTADPAALLEMQKYNTSGILIRPLVTMHTTGDPVVPYFHEVLYGAKVLAKKSALNYVHIPIARYGHCSFKSSEAVAGFALMVYKTTGQLPPLALGVLPSSAARSDYQRILSSKGVK